ncbi:MAG: hypothetical protein HZA49_02660 [Planctomycetes bacterium]|nr:hypothetical protein [Planctomycetota bacterium]
MTKKLTIVLGTKNPHKVREIMAIWRLTGRKPDIRFIPLSKFKNTPEVKETGRTYLANAAQKAIAWARFTGLPVLAEDSGIEVKALNWQPGIYSARFASLTTSRYASTGNRKNAAYKDNNQKLLAKLKGLPMSQRTARYRCSAVLASSTGRIIARTEGVCWGRITFKPSGRNGFGYDPIFTPTPIPITKLLTIRRKRNVRDAKSIIPIHPHTKIVGVGVNTGLVWGLIPRSAFGKTFGRLPAGLKHRISHRSIALRKIFKKIH